MTTTIASGRRWRQALPLTLAGALGGLIAFAAAFAFYPPLYQAAMELAGGIDSWLAYFAFFGLVVVATPLAGAAGGLLGMLPGGLLLRQRGTTRRALLGWLLAWMLGAAGLWSAIVMGGMPTPGDQGGTWWIWLLAGAALGGMFGVALRDHAHRT
ncbi:MAG TPA: hypothetical protein VFS21_07800 [Roseiflexaceae bacterium]|nr:hypothetical protein [Roseiflexaceae bacterium]